jgi:hypothetical protein
MGTVTYLAQRKQEEGETSPPETELEQANKAADELVAVMARNKANLERIAKERANANKSVLRSYRIKN